MSKHWVPDPWLRRVSLLLEEGFGVEDIALKLECDADAIRKVVVKLRNADLLAHLYRRGTA